ncbi:MAG: hypothetical protein ABIJ65_07750, partial [Chloroflexota bacterium]
PLWVFGFILALTIGGTTLRNTANNSAYRYNSDQNFQNGIDLPSWEGQPFESPQAFMETLRTIGPTMTEAIDSQPEIGILIKFLVVFIILMIFMGVGLKILGYVSETAVIRMVDDFETTSLKVSIKQGFRLGWSLASWRLFLIDLLIISLPAIVFISILVMLVWGGISLGINIGTTQSWVFTVVFLVGLVFLTILLFSIYFVIVSLLRIFFVRACVLEEVDVRTALRNGFSVVRRNWKEVGLFWLILIGLDIAWAIVSVFLLILLIPFFVVSFILAALVASLPGLVVGGFSTIFLSGYWPLVIGIVFGLPLFIPLAGSPLLFFEGLVQLFKSASWTLVYRELKTINLVGDSTVEARLVEKTG